MSVIGRTLRGLNAASSQGGLKCSVILTPVSDAVGLFVVHSSPSFFLSAKTLKICGLNYNPTASDFLFAQQRLSIHEMRTYEKNNFSNSFINLLY